MSAGWGEEYDYEDDVRSAGDITGSARRIPPSSGTTRGGGGKDDTFHAEVKKKRAHNVVHESLARTLSSPNQTTGSGSSSVRVQFRSTVQYRVSAYVTWPERPEPCSAGDAAVAGYIFRYKAVDDVGEFVARNLAANFVLLENLMPNTRYRYQVKYVMGGAGSSTDWSQEALLDTHYSPTGV